MTSASAFLLHCHAPLVLVTSGEILIWEMIMFTYLVAQATQEVTELNKFAAWFSVDLLFSGIVGAFISATMIYTDKMEKAAEPGTPSTPAAVYAKMIRSIVCGIGLAVLGGAATIDYLTIDKPSYRLLVGGGYGFFGPYITAWLAGVGFPGILRILTGKTLPGSNQENK